VALLVYFAMPDIAIGQSGRQMSDESLELGKKWMALAQAAAGARVATDDMKVAWERMGQDRSDAAWSMVQMKRAILLSFASNLGDLACGSLKLVAPGLNKGCELGKDFANTLNSGWQCDEGDTKACQGMKWSYSTMIARAFTENGAKVVAGAKAATMISNKEIEPELAVTACDAYFDKGCPYVAIAKNIHEATELRALQGQLDRIFNNNLSIGNAALQKMEQRARELERQAGEALVAYRTQREKDEAVKAERIKREQEEMAQTRRAQEERQEAGKRQEMEQPKNSTSAASQESESHRQSDRASDRHTERTGTGAPSPSSRSENASLSGGSNGGKSFDVTVWNYGDPVPGVERPAEFDKPKRKSFCHFKDTSCLNPFDGGVEAGGGKGKAEQQGQQRGGLSSEKIRQDIDKAVRGGLLSSEQIRQHIDQVVRPGWHDPDKGEDWHDPDKGEGHGMSPDEQLITSSSLSNHASVLPNRSLPSQLPSRKERAQSERYRERCTGIFNNLQASMQAATNLSLEVADSQGVGNVSAQIKGMMSQLPIGYDDGGELVKQMIVMAGGEDRAIALTRQSLSEWRRYLADLQRHSAKDYAIPQQKYQTLITLGNESVRVSEITLEALDCYRMNK